MFVNARIINRKEKKNPSQIIIDTFAVFLKSKSKTPMFVAIIIIIFFKQWSISLTKAYRQT